ncbi:nicotinate-nucleotide adenylyltransferase [Pseudanabaena mucicola]|uniref:nicotinate-nucleotide adenylyltransferase n=1 Tax=Pseudanabaena mucicola FACHB-723 TaxID=2692860 RepID=A0ABR8A160_9CYAN|nr:nicotinate-nucleotide adenylyltransferase [Pseudanabaena mucicola]MBD2189850.1 nicotinate-nucleotide adenylyltransferase [Pseudanabaena mucicola FACHB-723]
MNIALFGTSADPPSIGHQQILQWLDNHYDRVLVWVSDNPFKTHQASLCDRLKMMELTIAAIEPPAHTITIHPELSHPRTIHTVEQAKQILPDANFTLVIGGDLVPQLPTWYRAQDLLSQVHLLVVPRQGVSIAAADIERLERMGTEIAIAPESTSIPNVSSSDYRNNGNSSVIIPTVAAYIQRESLYAWQTSPAP